MLGMVEKEITPSKAEKNSDREFEIFIDWTFT